MKISLTLFAGLIFFIGVYLEVKATEILFGGSVSLQGLPLARTSLSWLLEFNRYIFNNEGSVSGLSSNRSEASVQRGLLLLLFLFRRLRGTIVKVTTKEIIIVTPLKEKSFLYLVVPIIEEIVVGVHILLLFALLLS